MKRSSTKQYFDSETVLHKRFARSSCDMSDSGKESVKSRLQSLLQTNENYDVEFIVGDEKARIKGHKVVMAAASPVFNAMFYGDLSEKNGPIKIIDIQEKGFVKMLEYIYHDQTDFESPKQATMTLQAARKYMIPSLEEISMNYILYHLCATNVCETHAYSALNFVPDVLELCVNHMKKHTAFVLVSEEFCDADIITVEEIVKLDTVYLVAEVELFKAVERWIKQESLKRGLTIGELLPEIKEVMGNIRFLAMAVEELASSIKESVILDESEKIALLLNKVQFTEWPFPEKFSKCADIRSSESSNRKWTLTRTPEQSFTLSINRYTNPFPKKSITVSRNIKLTGFQLPISNGDIRVIITSSDGNNTTEVNLVNELVTTRSFCNVYSFPAAVCLRPGNIYWISFSLQSNNNYEETFFNDKSRIYFSNNTIVEMNEHFSPITELNFEEM